MHIGRFVFAVWIPQCSSAPQATRFPKALRWTRGQRRSWSKVRTEGIDVSIRAFCHQWKTGRCTSAAGNNPGLGQLCTWWCLCYSVHLICVFFWPDHSKVEVGPINTSRRVSLPIGCYNEEDIKLNESNIAQPCCVIYGQLLLWLTEQKPKIADEHLISRNRTHLTFPPQFGHNLAHWVYITLYEYVSAT